LAAAAGLADSRRLGRAARTPARRAQRRRLARPAPGAGGLLSRPRAQRGAATGPEPGQPRPPRLEAPPDRGRGRSAAGGVGHRRAPQRRHPADPAGRGDPGDPGSARPAKTSPALPTRRSGLRPRRLPPQTHRQADHPDHRAARNTSRLRPGLSALAGGTQHRLAAPIPPATHPLGTPRRHPPGPTQPRLLDHLSTPT